MDSQNFDISIVKGNLTTCMECPFHVNSKGAWVETSDPEWWLNNALPLFQLQLVLIFCLTQIFYLALNRYGIPKLASQILTGLVLGISWSKMDKFKLRLYGVSTSQDILGMMTMFGYQFFLFLTGVKMDVSMIGKVGKKAMAIGVLSLVVPLIAGLIVQYSVRPELNAVERLKLPFAVAVHALTSFPVISTLISELKMVNSELGRLGLSSALVSDVLSIFLTFLSSIVRISKTKSITTAYTCLAAAICYILVISFAVRPAMYWIIQQTPEGKPVKSSYIHGIIFLALLSAVISTGFDQYAIFGPYLLGLAIPDGPPLGSALVEKLECFVNGIFLPPFISVIVMKVDLIRMVKSLKASNPGLIKGNIIIAMLTSVVKVVACLVPSMYCKMPFRDSMALALIMSCKGAVELASLSILRDNMFFDEGIYGVFTIYVLCIAIIVPIAVKHLNDPSRKFANYQNRTVMHLKANSELKLLAAIHRNDNISALINLFNTSSPTEENPTDLYVLHLIELIGRSAPIFISHQMQKKTFNNVTSCSENVILSFGQFERENRGAVTVETFTAISPLKSMHEDIYILALDKLTSLIILPFHRTWTIDGNVNVEDNIVRNLNMSVLKRAPCSVGIFVDRGHLGRSNVFGSQRSQTYSICVIFLGGKDDREAVTYAKRMAKSLRVNLTVVRFVSTEEEGVSNWEKMLDSEILKDFKFNKVGEGLMTYVEELVNDGPESALILRSMVDDYDLIIVGRRYGIESPQMAGLTEWSEFPELGVLGDLLASTDIKSTASVLVMQQQQQINN